MANLLSPGINVSERDLTTTTPGLSSWIGALAGAFTWGPANKVVVVSNEQDLVSRFGKPSKTIYDAFFLAADYLTYSNNIKIVRSIGADSYNAFCGGNGTGLTLSPTAVNGIVTSVAIGAGGTGYSVGDFVNINGGVTKALIKVTAVSNAGVVTSVSIIAGGTGYSSGSGVATTKVTTYQIENADEFEEATNLPEVIAAYPGDLGNSIIFSSARASEFDTWRYKNRYIKAPTADVIELPQTGFVKVFSIDAALPSDAVVTVDGTKITSGSSAGQYSSSSTTLTIHTDSEDFTGTGALNTYTLTNAAELNTELAIVTVDDVDYPLYTGAGDVPLGKVKIVGNAVTFGVTKKTFSGDGATRIFTITGDDASADAKVTVNGVAFTKTGSTPSVGQVQVAYASSNTTLTFNVADTPAIGTGNIVVTYDYPVDDAEIVIEYGFPTDKVKVFYNQTGIHAVVADIDGKITGDEPYSIIEYYTDLSLVDGTFSYDGTDNYYKTYINRNSSYVKVSNLSSHTEKLLSHGANGTVDDSDLIEGYSYFANKEETDINYLIGGGLSAAVANYIIKSIAEVRGDVVAYLTPPKELEVNNRGNELADIVEFKRTQLPSSSYGHFANGWKKRIDIYNNRLVAASCAADHAGCWAKTAAEFEPWEPGAGISRGKIKNAVNLYWSPNQTQRDELYVNGINPTVNFTNQGPTLFGDKTMLNEPSDFSRMNVRYLFITVRRAIAESSRAFLFKINNEITQNRFRSVSNAYLRNVKGRGGVEDYKVVCDTTNNNASVRQRNEFVGDIYIKPTHSINFIQLNFIAVNGDVSFDEIIKR